MPLCAIAFDESTSVGRLQQELFRSHRNQRSAESITCSKCSLLFAVFFPNLDDPENIAYIKALEKKISDDCATGRHAAEYVLNMTP
jgi:hypothetical protein